MVQLQFNWPNKPFENIKVLIATNRLKETAIAPIFEREIGVICISNTLFDTEILATFSGEIERKLEIKNTLKEKFIQVTKFLSQNYAM